MRKKLFTAVSLVALATVFAVVALLGADTRAQEGTEEESCPPELCYSTDTPEFEEEEDTRGTCSCGLAYDPDCHYETVPAFACLPEWHEEDNPSTKEWYRDFSTGDWGLKKYYSSSPELNLVCPIPADSGSSSVKKYTDIAQVVGYFYHYNSSYTSRMEVYTGSPFGSATLLGKGTVADSGSGQRSLYIYPTGTMYEHWFARIAIASHYYSSFHGLRVCYDPD
jgi:hypothetical protein